MARTCPKCKQSVRWDENLVACYFSGGYGNGQACERCVAEETGAPVPEPPRYPAGGPIPRHPITQGDMPICGLCRVALPDGQERGKSMRVRECMIPEGDQTEAGCYSACNECIAKWRPRILEYLKREGLLPADATERQVQGGWLF